MIDNPNTGSDVDDTRRCLHAAVAAEKGGCERYPAFAAVAREEGLAEVAEWFDVIAHAKRAHVASFVRALQLLQASDTSPRASE